MAGDCEDAMEPTRYFIRGRTYVAGDPGLQDDLERIYDSSERPRCMCVPGGVEMYIAKHSEYVIKRMPDTGHQHHPTCPSFEPEPGTSGLGELVGDAIIEHSPDRVEVRIDFPISRMPGRAIQRGAAIADPAEVHAGRKRVSLRALLHYLYQRAGFNRWYPAMEGRRNQGVLHKYLTEAAAGVIVKGERLAERLYVPEPFRVEIKEEIGERRRRKLELLHSSKDDVQFKMAILVGEYNGSEPTNFGRRITIRHMPDVPLFMEHKAWQRVERIHGAMLQARDADVARKPRVLVAALIYAMREHVYAVDTLSMMLTTDQWIPVEGLHELPLIEALQREQRAFMKPLRYDARTSAIFPNALLLDCGGSPVPLHVTTPLAEAKEMTLKQRAILANGAATWVWHTGKEMPALPPRVRWTAGGMRQAPCPAEPRSLTGSIFGIEELARQAGKGPP